eukprot:g11085.t1
MKKVDEQQTRRGGKLKQQGRPCHKNQKQDVPGVSTARRKPSKSKRSTTAQVKKHLKKIFERGGRVSDLCTALSAKAAAEKTSECFYGCEYAFRDCHGLLAEDYYPSNGTNACAPLSGRCASAMPGFRDHCGSDARPYLDDLAAIQSAAETNPELNNHCESEDANGGLGVGSVRNAQTVTTVCGHLAELCVLDCERTHRVCLGLGGGDVVARAAFFVPDSEEGTPQAQDEQGAMNQGGSSGDEEAVVYVAERLSDRQKCMLKSAECGAALDTLNTCSPLIRAELGMARDYVNSHGPSCIDVKPRHLWRGLARQTLTRDATKSPGWTRMTVRQWRFGNSDFRQVEGVQRGEVVQGNARGGAAPGAAGDPSIKNINIMIITGATGRIGVEIVKQVVAHFLSAKTAAHVVAVARSEKKGQAVLDQTVAAFPTVVAVAAGAGAAGLAAGAAAARAPSPRGSGAGAHTTTSSSAIKAKNNIKSNDGQVSVSLELCDVSLQSSVKAFAARWGRERPVHVLINNAAVTPVEQQFTAEKIDLQWATNVLGYHWMMREFAPMLMLGGGTGAAKGSSSSTSSPARVVNVASFYAGGLDLGDPEFVKTRAYDVDESYRASKMANRMQSRGFAEKWKADNIVVNAVHPGVATSSVSLGLGFDLDRSQAAAEKCARGPVYWAAAREYVLGVNSLQTRYEASAREAHNADEVRQQVGHDLVNAGQEYQKADRKFRESDVIQGLGRDQANFAVALEGYLKNDASAIVDKDFLGSRLSSDTPAEAGLPGADKKIDSVTKQQVDQGGDTTAGQKSNAAGEGGEGGKNPN